MRVYVPPCNRANVKKIPSAVEQFPPRRGFSVSRETARRHIANEAVMLFLKR